jgi:ABC-type sugar transport system ATPase subunit
MHRQLDMEIIFPIKDAVSAALMAVKAGCLRRAGVISEQQKQCVDSKIRTFLDPATLRDAPDCRFAAVTINSILLR